MKKGDETDEWKSFEEIKGKSPRLKRNRFIPGAGVGGKGNDMRGRGRGKA